ncbi:MAG: type II secretion system F family protein, partial [Mycetocola sp.]
TRTERGTQSGFSSRLSRELNAARLGHVAVPVFVVTAVLFMLMCGAILAAVSGVPAVALVGMTLGFVSVVAWVKTRIRRARDERRDQWPDVIDHLVGELRAGRSISQAIAELAKDGPELMRPDFGALARDIAATGDVDAALSRSKNTFADPVGDRIAETLRVARAVGGTDTVRVLSELGQYVRENETIRREVHARQSWVRNAAVLGAAAPWIILLLLSSRPETADAYRSASGTVLIICGIALTIAAYAAMLAIGRLRDEPRWLQ